MKNYILIIATLFLGLTSCKKEKIKKSWAGTYTIENKDRKYKFNKNGTFNIIEENGDLLGLVDAKWFVKKYDGGDSLVVEYMKQDDIFDFENQSWVYTGTYSKVILKSLTGDVVKINGGLLLNGKTELIRI